MGKSWTRREFLGASIAGPLALRGRAWANPGRAETPPLTTVMVEDLRAVVDEIIPEGDGMPAASAVNSVDYLTTVASRDREFRAQLRDSLKGLRRVAQQKFGKRFALLSPAQRLQALRAFESKNTGFFANLRDDVYEAYYTNSQIWTRIGYQFYPTNRPGLQMKPFDDSVLDAVRKKPRYYREVR
jgi:hypothetical protein